MATPGKVGKVLMRQPVATAMTDEATTANTARTRYQITDATKRNIDIATTPTVEVGGSAVAATTYNIEYSNGTVVFLEAQAEGAVVTVSGKYLDSNSIEFTDEATTANAAKTRYTISDADMVYWDKDSTVTVKLDDVTVTTGFHIEYPGGVVVFDSALDDEVVTVSGKYFVVAEVIGFFNWDLTVTNKTIDATTYESGEWEEYVLSSKNFKATAEKFWIVTSSYADYIGDEFIIVLYIDYGTAKTRFEGYGTINMADISLPVSELIKERIEFSGVQGIYFRQV